MVEYKNLKFLDGIRGLAAFYVLVHHARLLLTQPYYEGFLKHPEKYSALDKLFAYFFACFKFGHEAVLIFFVLSGFVIHLKQANNNAYFSVPLFYKKRIVRIYPVLLTSIIVTSLTAIILFLYNGDILDGFSCSNLIQNILLLPGLNIWGNNYPMWSLQHEWFFYLIYPVLLFLSKKNHFFSLIVVLSLNILFVFGIKIPLIGEASMTLLYWWLGALLAELFTKHQIPNVIIYCGLVFLPLKPFIINTNLNNIVFCLGISMILAYLLKNKTGFISKNLERFKFLGDCSFSIYLLHFPIQALIKEIYIDNHGTLPYSFHLVGMGILTSILIIYPIYIVTEKKTLTYKKLKLS